MADNIIIFYKGDISPKLEGITRIMIGQTEYSTGDGINQLLKMIVNKTGWRYASLRVLKGLNDHFYIAPDPVQMNLTMSIIKKSEILDYYNELSKQIRFIKED